MPDITVTEEQLAALESIREALSERAGPYATVRREDALQYLIDAHHGALEDDPLDGEAPPTAATEPATDGDAEVAAPADEATTATPDSQESASAADGDGGDDGGDRLNAMMRLLDTHAEKWDEADIEDARYVVTLPDGSEEHVQTKDNVRALLFKNYER